jgi:Ca2+-binding RTX toxin-like protein
MKSQVASQRARGVFGRTIRRGFLAAVAAGLVVAPSAGAVTYPVSEGNGFTTNTEGWSGTTATCSPGLLCSEQNLYDPGNGRPAGSIETRLNVFANAGNLFQGKGTWQSPAFLATASGPGALRYDRQVEVSGLASLNPLSNVEPVLVDRTNGKATSLGTNGLSDANTTFTTRTVAVPRGTLTAGHRYRLELRTTTTTSSVQVGVTGSLSVRYDNVSLRISNQGPRGASGSTGVKFTGSPLGERKITRLMRGFKWSANVGTLPGGSIIPRAQCTIVGTAKSDHIKGSKGNDVICGMGGNDKIRGNGGRDIIDTGSGNDRVTGAGGGDAVAGLAGRDRLYGNAGGDRVGGGAKADRLSGGASRDRINGGAGRDRLVGSARHDRVKRVERHA